MAVNDIQGPSIRSKGWGAALNALFDKIQGHLNNLINGTLIDDGVITEDKLDMDNIPASGNIMTFGTKMQWAAKILLGQIEIVGTPADRDILSYSSGDGKLIWQGDGEIPVEKLDFANTPSDLYVVKWNATAGKPEWSATASSTNTGEIRLNAGDSMDYMQNKILSGLKFGEDTVMTRTSGELNAMLTADAIETRFETFKNENFML